MVNCRSWVEMNFSRACARDFFGKTAKKSHELGRGHFG